MVTRNTYRILIWLIVILTASSLSMGISFWYHKQQDKKVAEQKEQQMEMPSEQRTRFFREQLNLRQDQMDTFRELNREYNRTARRIASQLEEFRIKLVEEMGKGNPNENELNTISGNIGKLHTEMKQVMIQYYLDMKAECDENQKKKLNEIFLSVAKSTEDVSLPQRGRQKRGRNSK